MRTNLSRVVTRLAEAGHWHEGDLPVLVVFHAGYNVTRLARAAAQRPGDVAARAAAPARDERSARKHGKLR